MQWGDVPTWIAAIGTVGTSAFSGLVLRRQNDDRLRDAVSDVTLVRYENGVVAVHGSRTVTVRRVRLVTSYAGLEHTIYVLAALTPGMGVTESLPGDLSTQARVRLYFLDQAGREWVRDEDGSLAISRGSGRA